MENNTIFINGMNFYKPNENAPAWIKGNIVIQKKELIEFLNTLETETVRIDLKVSKANKLYLALNTFNPGKKEVAQEPQEAPEDFAKIFDKEEPAPYIPF